jgi:hypothetical protein
MKVKRVGDFPPKKGSSSNNGTGNEGEKSAFNNYKDRIYWLESQNKFYFSTAAREFLKLEKLALREHLEDSGAFEWVRAAAKNKEDRKTKALQFFKNLSCYARETNKLAFAGSLAGYKRGVLEYKGKKLLIEDGPTLIDPAQGDYSLILDLLRGLVKEELPYLLAWLKVGYESLRANEIRTAPTLIMVGPTGVGKTLILNYIITPTLGGRCADPKHMLRGKTQFNGAEAESEVLKIDDDPGHYSNDERRMFASAIKEVTSDEDHRIEIKYSNAFASPPLFWRLIILANDGPDDLRVLPVMDEGLKSKVILLRAQETGVKLPSTNEERIAFRDTLAKQLPAFVHYLTKWKIPPEIAGGRYGVKAYLSPEIVRLVDALSDEQHFWTLVDQLIFNHCSYHGKLEKPWEGTATELQHKMMGAAKQEGYERQLDKLLRYSSAVGTYLGRLAANSGERCQGRIIKGSRKNNNSHWKILPVGWTAAKEPDWNPAGDEKEGSAEG